MHFFHPSVCLSLCNISCPRYNLHMHWWITIYLGTNVVLFEMMCIYPRIFSLPIKQLVFTHSWPVVVYTFGQVQRTSQVERKTKCSKKNNGGGFSHPLDCLVIIIIIRNNSLNTWRQMVLLVSVWHS